MKTKNEPMTKNGMARHDAYNIVLRHPCMISSNVKKILRKCLNDLDKNRFHCVGCGAIQPELYIIFNDKEYRFVCFEIAEYPIKRPTKSAYVPKKQKIVDKTDYVKFGEHCRKHAETKMKE